MLLVKDNTASGAAKKTRCWVQPAVVERNEISESMEKSKEKKNFIEFDQSKIWLFLALDALDDERRKMIT